jgi:glycerol-3-phosphate acyltransferase PlsX
MLLLQFLRFLKQLLMALTRTRIAIDAMGGDYAPQEIVLGAFKAHQELDVDILLVGDPAQITDCLQARDMDLGKMTIVPAEDVISMEDDPMSSLRRKPRASINVAMNLVKSGEADAVLSAGHSGAAMAAALLRLGRLPGVDRPAIGVMLPTVLPHKQVLILDVGANVDCRPKFLEQFAVMGSTYSHWIHNIPSPRVGLLNIGEEASKGNELALRAHQLLQKNNHINFVGNAEGRDILSGQFDVIVCDGFVGNTILKFAEAMGEALLNILKEELPRGFHGQVGSSLLKPNLRRIKQRMDHAEHGGGLLLGVAGICVISHGSSKARSIFHAIRFAKEAVDHRVLERLKHRSKESFDAPPPASLSSPSPVG